MGLMSMITGAGVALGAVGSLFKHPAQAALDTHTAYQAGMTVLAAGITLADPTFSPTSTFTQINSSLSGITASITSKISSIGTELSLVTSATKSQSIATAVDAVSSGNLAAIPNQITQAYPPSTDTHPAFASITSANSIVSSGADAIASQFDNTGFMTSLYINLNNLPGVSIANGKDLLTLLSNNPSPAVVSTVNTAIAADPALLSGLEAAFTAAGSSTSSMTSSFSSVVASSTAAVQSAISFVTGSNLVGMINSPIPSIANVMSSVINPAMVDQKSMVVAASISNKTVTLPGTESLTVSTTPAPIPAVTTATATNATSMIDPPPGVPTIVPYTSSETDVFFEQTKTQFTVKDNAIKDAAVWFKTNVEDWKQSVQYDAKKTAAGATIQNVVGTSTDPVVLAAWKEVYDQWVPKREFFNSTYHATWDAEDNKYKAMILEFRRRLNYGKYPYTYMASQGLVVAPADQTTYLDTTK